MQSILRRLHVPDIIFFAAVIVLTGFGLVMVYSASSVSALERFGDSLYYLKRQLVFAGAGLVSMFLVLSTDYQRWVKLGAVWLAVGAAGLVMLHIPGLGVRAGGALRWVSIGGLTLQPSEFVKLACLLYYSKILVKKHHEIEKSFQAMLPFLGVAAVMGGLLLTQPDFGNAVIVCTLTWLMLLYAGAPLKYLFGMVLGALPLVYILIAGKSYRLARLTAFLDPFADPLGSGYQIVQSFLAFFSGGLFGSGLGNSQEKLYYLPEIHTDFISAVVGEELGFLGMFFMIACFAVLLVRGFRIALRARDRMGFLLAAGCTSMLALQAFLNMCVVMGMLPTKGLPLPFISHGGSSLLVSFLACGMIQSVARVSSAAGASDGPKIRVNSEWPLPQN